MENSPEEYIAALVQVFRAVRRVLRSDGTCWLNLADTFRNKQQQLIPHRVALALQADGWILRSTVVWNKPNCMPASVTDRPTDSHEYVFLLSKNERYFYDADAIREPHTDTNTGRYAAQLRHGTTNGPIITTNPNPDNNTWHRSGLPGVGRTAGGWDPAGRNRRSVWTIPTAPYPGAHYATFPEKLVELMVLAGSRPGDTVLDPFAGSGTTLRVAMKHGRDAIGIELNESYIREQAEARTNGVQTSLVSLI